MPSNDYYTVSVRVQQSERLACKRAAEIAGTTVSAWSRQKLLAALRPDDYVEQIDEPEDAAQEDHAADSGSGLEHEGLEAGNEAENGEGSPQLAIPEQVQSDGFMADQRVSVAVVNQQPERGLRDRPGGSSPEQPLTYRKVDLCSRCQRIGPSCSACRTLIRGKRLA